MDAEAGPPRAIAIVGAGPRGTSLLERLVANAGELLDGGPLVIHLLDPYPAGPGRVWRRQQPGLLWLNSTAADNTMYPDGSVRIDGPTDTGPDLVTWTAEVGRERLAGTSLGEEAARLDRGWFPSRHLYGEYLTWMVEQAVAAAPSDVEVRLHRERTTDLTEEGGRQIVHLEGGGSIVADAVLLAQGHQDVDATPDEAGLAAFAGDHHLVYVPTAYSADPSLDDLPAGADVLVRGAGLAFVDCMVMLTEGRGGTYEDDGDSRLRYRPSGQEPRLLVGSRRGVPYHAKTSYSLLGPRPPLPRFFAPRDAEALHARRGPLRLRTDLWPLLSKELAFGWYHELWHGHPERVNGEWEAFVDVLAETTGDGHADPELVRWVPDPADRLEVDALDRPLAGRTADGADGVHALVATYLTDDLARRANPYWSPDGGLLAALLSCFATVGLASNAGWLTKESRVQELDGWFHGWFSFLASGPPPIRARQLEALAAAGIVHFLGPDIKVWADPVSGSFRAEGSLHPGVEAPGLLEARLPQATVTRSTDPLVRALLARGECTPDLNGDALSGGPQPATRLHTDAGYHVVDASGQPHPARFALGPWTDRTRLGSGVARPGLNAAFFRHNDAVARAALALAGGGAPGHAGSQMLKPGAG